MASKIMKRDEIGPFLKALGDAFAREIDGLKFTKKTRGDLKAGFADGARSALCALERDGYLNIDRNAAPGAVSEA